MRIALNERRLNNRLESQASNPPVCRHTCLNRKTLLRSPDLSSSLSLSDLWIDFVLPQRIYRIGRLRGSNAHDSILQAALGAAKQNFSQFQSFRMSSSDSLLIEQRSMSIQMLVRNAVRSVSSLVFPIRQNRQAVFAQQRLLSSRNCMFLTLQEFSGVFRNSAAGLALMRCPD